MLKEFLAEASNVKPSKRQLDWYNMEQYVFCHFTVNTFTDREWGDGTEDEKLFNPTNLDCDQWVAAVKAGGFKGIVLTAKHHDGFCLWPSKYTEHSVKNSMFKGDVVKECADACRRGGIKFGFYLSPWDRNSKYYGTPEYNDYFCNQLTELLTGYGDIFCVWFDGACGEGADGKVQKYDFARYIELIRKYQPNAVIFNDNGPDTRWVGNEAGRGRAGEWAVVPTEMCKFAEAQTGPGPLHSEGKLDYVYNTWEDIGSMSKILFSKGLAFVPSEVDTTLSDKGWFWHPGQQPKSLENLFNIYVASVGNNSCLNLNVSPNREGRFDETDVQRLAEFKKLIDDTFAKEAEVDIELMPDSTEFLPKYSIKCKDRRGILNFIVVEEEIEDGQRIETYVIRRTIWPEDTIITGGTIGRKKIIDLRRGNNQYCLDYQFCVTASRGPVKIKSIKCY